MCGIVGYIGNKKATPILINGLLRLEYRGYDSAGISTIEKEGLSVMKDKGRVKNLNEINGIDKLEGTIGILIQDGLHMENHLKKILILIWIIQKHLVLFITELLKTIMN